MDIEFKLNRTGDVITLVHTAPNHEPKEREVNINNKESIQSMLDYVTSEIKGHLIKHFKENNMESIITIEKKVIVFDLDGTLWESVFERDEYDKTKGTYKIVGYYVDIIEMVNNLYERGFTIILQTARHWDKFEQTKQQLQRVKYHSLVMGNIPADIYVNDKGITPEGFIKFYEANLRQEVNHV